MRPFTYVRAEDEARALGAAGAPGTRFLAGGTTLIDLMRLGVETPAALVDIGRLPLAAIEASADGGVRLGAMARNSDVAVHPLVAARYPVLSQALLAGASPQLRNMATVGGNLMQRTRCSYFRDPGSPCNKRVLGSGCPAWEGYNRGHAVLGGSHNCIATHPSDMCVALVALDAIVVTGGVGGRAIPGADFHGIPGDHPEIETVLRPRELITRVALPATPFAVRSVYVKVRDRASYAFALASAAVALDVQKGKIAAARVALGGVGTKPWRSREAEGVLVGSAPDEKSFAQAADVALRPAEPRVHNAFKIELARRTLRRALELAMTMKVGTP